jgi:kumamolisin
MVDSTPRPSPIKLLVLGSAHQWRHVLLGRTQRFLPVVGSAAKAPPFSEAVGRPDLGARIAVTVLLRPTSEPNPNGSPDFLDRAAYARKHGSRARDITLLERFGQRYGLEIGHVSTSRRSVVFTGSIRAFSTAFQVPLTLYRFKTGAIYRCRTGPIFVPAILEPVVTAVLGLDDRPAVRSHHRVLGSGVGKFVPARAGTRTFTPLEVARIYKFPPGAGRRQTIGIIELGGGYSLRDLRAYFRDLGLGGGPAVTAVSVDGAANDFRGRPGGADGEVALDIELAGAVAPGAQIVVYFAPNTARGFHDAVSVAIHDKVHRPSIISISWGAPELRWSDQSRQELNRELRAAALLGLTVLCSSGDDGSSDGIADGRAHVDFPASSPYVTGCGGTTLTAQQRKRVSEVAWNELPQGGATGGGISAFYPVPEWQRRRVPPSVNPGSSYGRGVPDISANADPYSGYRIRVGGRYYPIGGTSAVSPLMAGLVARLNERLGRHVGCINPVLYGSSKRLPGPFFDVTRGRNPGYVARRGWDGCTGLGVPNGQALLQSLQSAAGR